MLNFVKMLLSMVKAFIGLILLILILFFKGLHVIFITKREVSDFTIVVNYLGYDEDKLSYIDKLNSSLVQPDDLIEEDYTEYPEDDEPEDDEPKEH